MRYSYLSSRKLITFSKETCAFMHQRQKRKLTKSYLYLDIDYPMFRFSHCHSKNVLKGTFPFYHLWLHQHEITGTIKF